MKNIKEYGWYEIDGKNVLIVGSEYMGSPWIMWKYDVLICSKDTYTRFKDEVVCDQLVAKGWSPIVRFI